jgi:hypothetical protein
MQTRHRFTGVFGVLHNAAHGMLGFGQAVAVTDDPRGRQGDGGGGDNRHGCE